MYFVIKIYCAFISFLLKAATYTFVLVCVSTRSQPYVPFSDAHVRYFI